MKKKKNFDFGYHLPLLPLRHASTEPIWGLVIVPPAFINKVQQIRHIHTRHQIIESVIFSAQISPCHHEIFILITPSIVANEDGIFRSFCKHLR